MSQLAVIYEHRSGAASCGREHRSARNSRQMAAGVEFRGCSSAGRAPALQAGGHRFEPVHLHHSFGVEEGSWSSRKKQFRCCANDIVGHPARASGLGCVGLWTSESGSGASLGACVGSDVGPLHGRLCLTGSSLRGGGQRAWGERSEAFEYVCAEWSGLR